MLLLPQDTARPLSAQEVPEVGEGPLLPKMKTYQPGLEWQG
jgi:hypothetical protein